MLREIDAQYCRIDEIEVLEQWVEESNELSNPALKRAIADQDSICLKKALSWSEKVNASINELQYGEKKPFEGVKEALAYAHEYADIAMVSSANEQAVIEEWDHYHLLERIESRNGVHTVEAAAALGYGSREYELVEVE